MALCTRKSGSQKSASLEDRECTSQTWKNSELPSIDLQNEIDDLAATRSKLGAKNLIPYPYYDTTKTVNGITFTDNGDGTITANGTATATSTYTLLLNNSTNMIGAGNFIISGVPNNANCRIYVNKNGSNLGYADKDNDYQFTLTEGDTIGFFLWIANGTTVENLTFYPMLRLATDHDSTWQPYAMTNKELTDAVNNIDMSVVSDEYDSTLTYSVGDYCIYNNTLYECITTVTVPEVFDSTKWRATNVGAELNKINTDLSDIIEWTLFYTGECPANTYPQGVDVGLPNNYKEVLIVVSGHGNILSRY